jgi:hypothetical protein
MFVPEEKQPEVYTALQKARQDVGYYEEVHYQKLRGHLMGPKARCAKAWLNLYARQFSEFCFFHCLAVDTHSQAFEHHRFGGSHYAYNRFARMAFEGSIAWSLKNCERVALRFYSDEKFRNEGDNFAEYIPKETVKSIAEKRRKKAGVYPVIRFLHPEVNPVNSDPRRVDSSLREECELIQLVDLMTSNIVQALTARSGQEAKTVLAEMVAQWIQDTRKPPWMQTEDLHRRFSVSFFPGFYSPSLAILNKDQPFLSEEWEN